jgi:large subunit ribosomal protein L24
MNIKTGDKVKILAGKDKGKTGKVLQTFPGRDRASVEGLNVAIKHLRPRRRGENGQRVEFPAPIQMSNLQLVCPKCGKPTRIGHKLVADTKGKSRKYRICKKCEQVID